MLKTPEILRGCFFVWKEQHLYGSSRLGIFAPEVKIQGVFVLDVAALKQSVRSYELTNHLGNVLSTITDKGVITSAQDYFPFGLTLASRSFTEGGSVYRYSFNGKEDDKGLKQQDYGMRIYRSDLGRFLSVDPIARQYPELTPYQFASNTPIQAIDLDGLEMYYSADGSYIGKSGKSTEIRIITDKNTVAAAKENLANSTYDHKWLSNPVFSKQAFINSETEEKALMKDWATINQPKIEDRESTMTLFTKVLIDSKGNKIEVTMPGSTELGPPTDRYGTAVVDPKSSVLKMNGVDMEKEHGWQRGSMTHTHTRGSDKFSNEPGLLGGMMGDIPLAIKVKQKIYLVAYDKLRLPYIQMFDPKKYNVLNPKGPVKSSLDEHYEASEKATDRLYIPY